MMIKKGKLSFFEALMLVAGAGLGTGILTIPYAIRQIGMVGTLSALAVAYAVSLCLYLILADLTLHSKDPTQLLGILKEHLFRGKYGRFLSGLFFVILVIMLLENLVVYILCASDALCGWLHIPPTGAKVLFYLLASLVILFGVKGIGVGEKYSVALIGTVVALLTVMSLFRVKHGLSSAFGQPSLVFAVYGLFMFAFSAIFSVIQVCNYIEDVRKVRPAIVGGLTVNATMTLIFAMAALIGSKELTPLATVGLSDSLAESISFPALRTVCALLVLAAMLSSFWSSGLAFADTVQGQFGIPRRGAWFVSTLPALLLSVLLPLPVLEYMQIGAGALSVILVMVVLPAYVNAVKHSEQPLLLGRAGKSRWTVGVIGIFIFLMAISSLIPID